MLSRVVRRVVSLVEDVKLGPGRDRPQQKRHRARHVQLAVAGRVAHDSVEPTEILDRVREYSLVPGGNLRVYEERGLDGGGSRAD
ncbi:MAG: hypothetical protein L0221_16185, partial [Chloroflexi bacterium]|nr:hypothetical protein [Chloroflexota bacterium]